MKAYAPSNTGWTSIALLPNVVSNNHCGVQWDMLLYRPIKGEVVATKATLIKAKVRVL